MYKVMKAIIVRNGKPVMTFPVEEEIRADQLKAYKKRIKDRYVKGIMDEIQVDLQYKRMGEEE